MRDELVYVRLGLGEQPIPYLHGWELQRQIHGERVNDEIPDTCLLLQHEPVFTAGKRTSPLDRPPGDAGAPVVEVDRGGKITWHRPGQLVTMHGFALNCDCALDWFSRFVPCGIRTPGRPACRPNPGSRWGSRTCSPAWNATSPGFSARPLAPLGEEPRAGSARRPAQF